MSIRNGLVALAILAALSFSACSGSGSGGVTSSGLPPSSSGAISSTATRTYQLGNAAGSYDLPELGGFSGSLALPATTVPANTRLQLTSSFQAPAGAPIIQGVGRRPQATGTLDVYFYTTIRLSSTVTFPTLPGFSVKLPMTVDPTGLQFFYAISDPKPTNGAEVQFRTEGPATVSGQIVTFAPSITPLILQAGRLYTIAFYAISAIVATPTAAGKIYITNCGHCSNTGNDNVTTYAANGVQTTPTITTGVSNPRGMAVDGAGKIYVVNEGNNTLTTYNAAGVQTTRTAEGAPTTPTISQGLSFNQATAVALH
jgi:hypothetical protein